MAIAAGLASALSAAAPAIGAAPGLAVTIDDFDLTDTPLMTAWERDRAIRRALRRHGIRAAGFVVGKYVTGDTAPRVLAAWSDERHLVGNHSFSHGYYSGRDPAATMADISRCETVLAATPAFAKLYRFPFLAEGDTAPARDALRGLLAQAGYRTAPVTIDTSDWFVDDRLVARLKAGETDLAAYRRFYLDHLWQRAAYYDRLARDVLGHSIDHTILLHHRLTTGLFLGDALAMFRARGWRLVDAATALATPELRRTYDTVPAGQSLMWQAAEASGRYTDRLRYPGEDGDYEAPKMDALRL